MGIRPGGGPPTGWDDEWGGGLWEARPGPNAFYSPSIDLSVSSPSVPEPSARTMRTGR